jgi:hypothetical protein
LLSIQPVNLKWYETGYFILKHDSSWVGALHIFFALAYLIEFFCVPYQIAFNFALLSGLDFFSTIIDGIACLDFLTNFFIEQEVRL